MNAALKALNGDYAYTTLPKADNAANQAKAENKVLPATAPSVLEKAFNSKEFGNVRVLSVENEPWFVAADIAAALEYAAFRTNLLKNVPDEWKGTKPICTLGGTQNMWCLSEQGLYFFLARSDKKKAIPFQKYVAGEVMPSIRKHGVYMTEAAARQAIDNPEYLYLFAEQVLRERDRRVAAEEKAQRQAAYIEEVKPDVDAVQYLKNTDETISMEQYAKILSKNRINLGRINLFKWLRARGYLTTSNTPYQQYMHYFKCGNCIANNRWVTYTRVTGKGALFFTKKILREMGYAKEYVSKVTKDIGSDFLQEAACS